MVERTLVITSGFSGYTRPYQAALGEAFTYQTVHTPREVALVDWTQVFAVVFSGGADIDPGFYGRKALTGTNCSPSHDALDAAVLAAIDKQPILKFGTCRGAQLLWAHSEGAQLIQHIPSHYGDHMSTRLSQRNQDRGRFADQWDDMDTPLNMEINSIHHQACIWDSWEPQGSGSRSPVLLQTGDSHGQTAVEAWCNASRGNLGFQWHPEWMPEDSPAYQWALRVIKVFAFGERGCGKLGQGYYSVPKGVYRPQYLRVDLTEEVRKSCHHESRLL